MWNQEWLDAILVRCKGPSSSSSCLPLYNRLLGIKKNSNFYASLQIKYKLQALKAFKMCLDSSNGQKTLTTVLNIQMLTGQRRTAH